MMPRLIKFYIMHVLNFVWSWYTCHIGLGQFLFCFVLFFCCCFLLLFFVVSFFVVVVVVVVSFSFSFFFFSFFPYF